MKKTLSYAMHSTHAIARSVLVVLLGGALRACVAPRADAPAGAAPVAELPAIVSDPATPRPPFTFEADDATLLDQVQRGAFNYLWFGATPETGMVPDRSSNPTISTAGVGFQLAAIPVGVERGWITREAGEARALQILQGLSRDPRIRHEGLFQHFIDGRTAGLHAHADLEHVVSTIDSALLFSGILVASQYFGGEVALRGDRLVEAANWRAFTGGDDAKPWERGFISLGWKSKDPKDPAGNGAILPYYWIDNGCEHRLVSFLAVCAPREEHRVGPRVYYGLRRGLGEYAGVGPIVFFPWSGAHFTYVFSHCFIDYASMGPDDPGAFGCEHRARVDWWENSRRGVLLHRRKCIENPRRLPTLGEHAWGLTASDGPSGYLVTGVFPKAIPMPGARAEWDYPAYTPKDKYGDGTIAPYAAATSIMFEPALALDAMRYYRGLKDESGKDLAWRDPASGGFGFVDAFNLRGPGGKGWAAPDTLAIDAGPTVLAIENARTGLIWRLFHSHPYVKAGMERLNLQRRDR